MAISAREIVRSVGMCDRPEYYSGRGVTTSDLDGDKLYAIYQKITQELGAKQAEEFVTMVKKLKTLSATNFLNSLYALEQNDWTADISFYESDGDVSFDKERIESIVFSLSLLVDELLCYIGADTEIIKSSFLGKVKPGRRRVIKRDIGGCKF